MGQPLLSLQYIGRWFLTCLAGGLLLGCEEVIDSPFEIIEPKLVIASTFAPHQPVSVSLTATQPVTGELQVSPVNDAVVLLFEGTNLIEELTFFPGADGTPGTYQTVNFHPEVNRHYTMHASADGFTPVSADSKIPSSIPITNVEVTDLSKTELLTTHVYEFTLQIDYEDPADQENFYDLRLSQEIIPFRIDDSGDTLLYPSVFKSVQSPGSAVGTPAAVGGQASLLLRDKPTENGTTIRLQSEVDPSKEILGSIVTELRTVSEPYFRFQRNVQNEGDVFSGIIEPRVNSYTNVNSGYGVFAGYSSFVRSVPFLNR